MKTMLIENDGKGQKAYNSLLMEPKNLSMFANELAMKMVKALSRKPGCAMDLARKLEIDEQKIYYHLRKLEGAGVVKLIGTEMRYGMTAKIYRAVSPVVSAKLYDDGHAIGNAPVRDLDMVKFLEPFILKGKLNARIIFGDPYPHGKFDSEGRDSGYAVELALLLGNFLDELNFPCHSLDIRTNKENLKNNNIILIGGPKGNTITHEVNSKIPVYFDEKNDWHIVSKLTGKRYQDDMAGIIYRGKSPFNPKKEIILLSGRRTRGTLAAIIAFTQQMDEVMKGNVADSKVIAKVVHGLDKDGDGVIDSIKFLE